MPELAEILASATPREEVVELCVAGALNSEFEALEAQLAELERTGPAPSSLADVNPRLEVAQKIVDVRERMREHTFGFRMRALGHRAWSDLRVAHPPRDGMGEAFNVESFPPALIAACCADPPMSVPQVLELFEVLNQGQRDLLFGAAWAANHAASIPFSRAASATLLNSEPS